MEYKIKTTDYFGFFYDIQLKYIILIIVLAIVLFGILGGLLSDKKIWKKFCFAVLIISGGAVITGTLFFRTEYYRGILLVSFQRLIESYYPGEVLQEMLLNSLIFVPSGLSLAWIVKGPVSKRIITVCCIALSASVVIETLQYVFSVGFAQGDDVMMNVFGAFLGSLSYPVGKYVSKKAAKKRLSKQQI